MSRTTSLCPEGLLWSSGPGGPTEFDNYDAPSDADLHLGRSTPHVLLGMRCRAANSTGKERDSESGLDNFVARFDSSIFRRFDLRRAV